MEQLGAPRIVTELPGPKARELIERDGRVTSRTVTQNGLGSAEFRWGYTPGGRLDHRLWVGPALSTEYAYDPAGRVSGITVRRPGHYVELLAYQYDGFWQPMDTLRDRNVLEELWQSGKAPWKTWT